MSERHILYFLKQQSGQRKTIQIKADLKHRLGGKNKHNLYFHSVYLKVSCHRNAFLLCFVFIISLEV